MNYTLTEILAAYKDCGITFGQAMTMITANPPRGLGYPWQTATDYLNSTERNCGDPISRPPNGVQNGVQNGAQYVDSKSSSAFNQIPDDFFGFLVLLGGLN